MDISFVITPWNCKDLLQATLKSIFSSQTKFSYEVIVYDHGSTDGSLEMVESEFPQVTLIRGGDVGFAAANNVGLKKSTGRYAVLLNADTEISADTIETMVSFMDANPKVGISTGKLVLAVSGKLDKACRRSFPTPWVSFKRIFLNGGSDYWYLDIPDNQTHEVDSVEGAFMLMPKKVLDKVGWLDEKYVFDGEDLDLCFQIKKAGYKIIYYPEVSITHLKKATRNRLTDIQIARKMEGVNSMERFYRKNLWSSYPILFNYFVLTGIKFLKLLRYLQLKIKI